MHEWVCCVPIKLFIKSGVRPNLTYGMYLLAPDLNINRNSKKLMLKHMVFQCIESVNCWCAVTSPVMVLYGKWVGWSKSVFCVCVCVREYVNLMEKCVRIHMLPYTPLKVSNLVYEFVVCIFWKSLELILISTPVFYPPPRIDTWWYEKFYYRRRKEADLTFPIWGIVLILFMLPPPSNRQ